VSLLKRFRALQDRLEAADKVIREEFPAWAELTNPEPVGLSDIQSILGSHEVMLTYAVADRESWFFAVNKKEANLFRIPLGSDQLGRQVQSIRNGVDERNIDPDDPLYIFDTDTAVKLYTVLIAAAVSMVENDDHLIVVPDGPLQRLPFGLLISEQPHTNIETNADYGTVDWLARHHPYSVLPAVSSLRALRTRTPRQVAPSPFIGYGDPVLISHPDGLEDDLARLPQTETELREMARALGASPTEDVHIGPDATPIAVETADLTLFRVVAFATHALGDEHGSTEPALVLSPSVTGGGKDDGLLTASRITRLQMNADWVILSACNTAAADPRSSAEGLSGLAKAFFYAGTKAILVSHWPVETNASVELTTKMVRYGAEQHVGRAQALQMAMMDMIQGKSAKRRHPIFWAPFVLAGDGQ
jgi:CHAT domain-containing protein